MKKILCIIVVVLTACDATVTKPLIVKEVSKGYGAYKYKVVIDGDLPDVVYYTDSVYKIGDTLK